MMKQVKCLTWAYFKYFFYDWEFHRKHRNSLFYVERYRAYKQQRNDMLRLIYERLHEDYSEVNKPRGGERPTTLVTAFNLGLWASVHGTSTGAQIYGFLRSCPWQQNYYHFLGYTTTSLLPQ